MECPTRPGEASPGGPGQALPCEGIGREALAFVIDMGICPGGMCLKLRGGCDPRCPALIAWVEEVSGG